MTTASSATTTGATAALVAALNEFTMTMARLRDLRSLAMGQADDGGVAATDALIEALDWWEDVASSHPATDLAATRRWLPEDRVAVVCDDGHLVEWDDASHSWRDFGPVEECVDGPWEE